MNHTMFFVNQNGVWHPLCQLHGVDKSFFKKFLYFILNHCFFLRIHQTKLMLDRLGVRISRYLIFDDSWINAWHFLIRLGKNIAEFFRQLRINSNHFEGVVHSNENILQDTRHSGDINWDCFNDTLLITLSINYVRSHGINRTRPISSHSQHEFSYLYSS